MASKRSTVTWKIPAKSNAKDDIYQKDRISVTREIQEHSYSDTFMSDSYSDTFVSSSMTRSQNGNSETENGKPLSSKSKLFSSNFLYAKTKHEQSISVEESSIQEATHLETARNVTDALETVQEISYRTEDFESFTGTDISDTHPPSNTFTSYTNTFESEYTDTFESEERTNADSKVELSDESEIKPSISNSYRTRCEDDENLLDQSYIAPGFNGKLLPGEDEDTDEGETLADDYSYSFTFEPTVTHQESGASYELSLLSGEDAIAAKKFLQSQVRNLRQKHEDPKGLQLASMDIDDDDDEVEDPYLKHYCKKKVKLLKTKRAQPECLPAKLEPIAHPLSRPAFMGESIEEYGVPETVMERARLNRIMAAMSKAAKEDFHEPRKCQECSLKKQELDLEDAQRQFVRAHTMRLKNKAMDNRVEEHLLKMNTVSMVAELARELPRHSDRPEQVMDRLLEPLLGKNVMR
ncbi:uncharacterized protein LOC127879151 [Dreissena polymorpha]|uniref:Uncharacterized protein n=1 Tax=Dreissena polymorpha TaxID=45954 RepID=A0A9D4QQN2_DREPO|nr:uncharacterized protein LOC127879151 [Dreissena polymorpha]KAH3839971.1 hypothetical protein DPMN_113412 [Dreissena polymorpha]